MGKYARTLQFKPKLTEIKYVKFAVPLPHPIARIPASPPPSEN